MANPITNDNFSAHPRIEQRKPDVSSDLQRSPERLSGKSSPPSTDHADIVRAQQRLSQENSGDVRERAIESASEAKHRVALLRDLLTDSPAAAMKAHGEMERNVFEAAMARPAA